MNLEKQVFTGLTLSIHKRYVGGIEYTGANLEGIYHAEGRLTPNGANFRYEYTLKDHLGNSRVSFAANGTAIQVLQENHYYPFGMEMRGTWITQSGTENAYQYTGKELNEDFSLNWSDYGARWYDASVGRWNGVDGLAEKYAPFSPYHYAGDNPILYLDIDGNQFTSAAWAWVNRLLKEIESNDQARDKDIRKYEKLLSASTTGEKTRAKAAAALDKAQKERNSYSAIRGEIDALAGSTQVYTVVETEEGTTNGLLPGSQNYGASTAFSGNEFQIRISSNANIALFAHELLHAYQFEMGTASIAMLGAPSGSNTNFLMDIYDELAGFTRQGMFGSNNGMNTIDDIKNSSTYKNHNPLSVDSEKYPSIQSALKLSDPTEMMNRLEDLAKNKNAAFRVVIGGKRITITPK